jgi:hypothetical protein
MCIIYRITINNIYKGIRSGGQENLKLNKEELNRLIKNIE